MPHKSLEPCFVRGAKLNPVVSLTMSLVAAWPVVQTLAQRFGLVGRQRAANLSAKPRVDPLRAPRNAVPEHFRELGHELLPARGVLSYFGPEVGDAIVQVGCVGFSSQVVRDQGNGQGEDRVGFDGHGALCLSMLHPRR
jgi:hypothetical protein